MAIGGEDIPGSGEGTDQHQQRGFRQVKVGEQSADHSELKSGIDEDAGFAAARVNASRGTGGIFERSDCGGSNSYDASLLADRLINFVGCVSRNVVRLAVQLVGFDFFGAHRLKRAKSDVQRNLGAFNTTLL